MAKKQNIKPVNFKTAIFLLTGTEPYVQHAFSAKARQEMKDKQLAGSTANKGKARDPKDFEECYRQSLHVSKDGWYGIPAASFRAAIISACRIVGFKMTLAKLSVFVPADGVDGNDGTPLIRITKGEPHSVEHMVCIQNTTDIRVRGMFDPGWEAELSIRFDADQFTEADICNLLVRVGSQVGIGEGRPDSKTSAGMGWGLFSAKVL